MNQFFTALGIGIVAGILDAAPMVLQKMNKAACISAFVHWLVLGILIPYVSWEIQPWLKGLIIAELTALPIMIIVCSDDPKSLIPMALFSAVLGIGVGLAGAKFIH